MTFRNYIIFREVSRTKNFTRAAENLFITQSAVSYAVKELEEEAGTKLFERLYKSVRLTKSGEILLSEILPILAECEKLEMKIKNLEKDVSLKIVSCITIALEWLPSKIMDFQKICPETPVNVEVNTAANAIEILKQGKADLALIEGNILQGNFRTKKFASYRLNVLASPKIYGGKEINLHNLLEKPLLLREKGSAVRDVFEGAAAMAGYHVYPEWTSVDSQTLLKACKAGFGYTVLPEIIAREEINNGNLLQVNMKDLDMSNDLTAAVLKNKYMNKPLQRLWDLF